MNPSRIPISETSMSIAGRKLLVPSSAASTARSFSHLLPEPTPAAKSEVYRESSFQVSDVQA